MIIDEPLLVLILLFLDQLKLLHCPSQNQYWFHNFYEKEVGEDVPYSHIVDKVSLVSADQNLHLRMVEKGDGIGIFYEFDLLNSKEQLKTIPIRNYPEKLNAMIAINKKWIKPQIAKIFLEMVSGRFS